VFVVVEYVLFTINFMQKKIYQLLGGANDASVGLYVLSWAILILVILGITFFIRWRVKVFLKERRDSKTD